MHTTSILIAITALIASTTTASTPTTPGAYGTPCDPNQRNSCAATLECQPRDYIPFLQDLAKDFVSDLGENDPTAVSKDREFACRFPLGQAGDSCGGFTRQPRGCALWMSCVAWEDGSMDRPGKCYYIKQGQKRCGTRRSTAPCPSGEECVLFDESNKLFGGRCVKKAEK